MTSDAEGEALNTNRPAEQGSAGGFAGLAHDFAAGGVVAFLCFAYSLSFALLLFAGPLVGSAPRGLAMVLFSAGLATLIVAATSSFRLATAGPDTATVAVLAAMIGALTNGGAPDASPAHLEIVALVALAGSTLFIGLMLLLFGMLRLGIWIRYVPFPVIGGFLSASGVMLVLGALRLLIGETVTFAAFPDPTEVRIALPVGMALVFAAILFAARARWRHPMVLPTLLLAAVLLIDIGLLVLGVTRAEARALGLLMEPVSIAGLGLPWIDAFEASVDPSLLFGHATEVAVATGVTAISILLNATGLEVSEKTYLNLDHELRINGVANLLIGACGGLVCNLSLNRSQANRASGGQTRLSGIVAGCLCLLSIVVGPRLIEWVPLPVVAGLLFSLGGQLIWDWLVRALPRLALMDSLLVVAIPVVAVQSGYLEAAAVGLVAACMIFAVKYSRMRLVKHDLTRREYASFVERSPAQSDFLLSNGDLIHILWIQGYLFFGTANRLYESGRARLLGADGRPIRFLVLDLSDVGGIDSSCVYSFMKLADRVHDHGATMILCGLSEGVRKAFGGTGLLGGHGHLVEFSQVDQALEWAEERLLDNVDLGLPSEPSFDAWLGTELRRPDFAERIMQYLEVIDLDVGAELFHQGDAADALYFVRSGRVSVVLHRPYAESIRLRSIAGYTVVGEMGLYRDQTRTASVIADRPSRVHRLTKAALMRMEREEPELSSAFHALIIRVLANRLAFTNTEIAALQR